MELSVIENDHIEVKKYLENFVPDNYYRVLGDAYLYQVRAVLQHAVRNAGEYNVRYDSLINSLTAQFEQNRVNIGQEISAWGNKHTVHAQRLTYLEAENNTVSASITELEKIIISNNKAILEKTNKLAAQLVDFEVGGVNLIHNSTFAKGYKAVGDVAITTSDHVLGTLFKIVNLADVEEEIGIGSLVEFNKIKLMEGKQYTLSFYGFGSVELINSIKLNKGDLVHTLDPIIMDSDISNRKTLTFIAPFSGDDIGFSIGTVGYPIDSWFSLVAIQLELGSRATDWSPSPFDNADYIARVAASLEEVRKITIEQQKVNVAAIDTLRANIGETKGQISNEREINLTKFSSMTRQLDELTSTTAGNTSRITNLDNTYTDKFTANAEKLVELEANIGASNAAITRVDEVVTTNTSAIATSTNNLSAKIDGIKIGGRNLIRNSTFKLGHEAWGDATITRKDTVLGSEVTVTNNGSAQFGIQNDVLFHTISLVEGDEYTLSFYGNGNIPSINSIWLKSEGKDPQLLSEIAIDAVLAEKKVLTFTSTITADDVSIIIAAVGYPKDSWFKIVALQLEKGNKATDWTEAPEDIVNFISGVEANINEFKEVQVGINGATATQLNTLNTKTDNSNAAIDELRETTSNIEGSTATLETKLRGEYTSAVSTAKSDITQATDGKIDAVKVTLREMTTDISSKADITRVDSVENNAKQSLATARTELTSSYTSAISTARTESATDATNKANKAKTDANTYTDGKVTTLTTLVNSKASISRVDDVENNANQALASTKTELTGEYTSAISASKEESASDAQIKADKALADANIVTATKASEAQEAAEAYALAKAKAEADAALALAKGDATSKSDAAKSAAIAAAALDAKNKADKALADAKLDATAKADAAKLYAKGLVDTLTTVVNSKADITRVDKVVNDSTQALAQAKTDIKGAYTLAITESSELSAADAQAKADKALADAAIKATQAQTAAETYALAEANAKAAAALDSAKSDATTKANKAKADAELAAALDAKKKADEALRLAKLDATAKADAVKDMVVALTKVVDSKASISRVDDIENNATQALATAKTELTSNYTTAITTAKNQSATDAKTKADAALAAAKIDAQDKANAAKTAAETYALAEAKAKADAALVLANSDATTKANAAKSAAEANAALDAKNKADKALADAKLDATAKANAAKTYADGIVKTLKTEVDSKATITQLNTVKNDANQALATAKTELTGSYTKAIEDIEIGGRNLLLNSSMTSGKGWGFNGRATVTQDSLYAYVTIIESVSTPGIGSTEYHSIDAGEYTLSGNFANGFSNLSFYIIQSGLPTFSVILEGVPTILGYYKTSFKVPRTYSNCKIYLLTNANTTVGSKLYLKNIKLERGNKATDWTPAPEDVTDYVDTSVSTLKTLVDSKASISRVDTVENNAKQALATAKTELTGSYTSAIATAKSQSATDAQTKATKALNDAKADTVLKANAAQTAAQAYALAEAKAKADAALVTAKSDSTTKANAAESAAKVAAALDAKNKADKALADAKIDSKAKADEAERLAKAHADTKVTALTKIVDSKASITSVEKVVNDANQALATAKTELTSSYKQAIDNIEIGGRNFLKDSDKVVLNNSDHGNNSLTVSHPQGYKSITAKANGNVYGYLTTSTQMDVGTYTMSIEVHTTYATSMYFRIGGVGDAVIIIPNTGGKWQRVTHTYTGTLRAPNTNFLLGFTSLQAGKIIHFRGLKVEKGNKATDWSAAPEDVEAAYTAAVSTESTARSNADTALGNRITATDAIAKNAQSRVTTAETAITNANNAIATTNTKLETSFIIKDNFLANGHLPVTSSAYQFPDYILDKPLVIGDTYKVTVRGELSPTRAAFQLWNHVGQTKALAVLTPEGNGIYTASFTYTGNPVVIGSVRIYQFHNTQSGTSTINSIEIVRDIGAKDRDIINAAVAAESKARSDADTALGSRITTLDTDYKGNKTAIRSELTAVSNKTNSTATSLGTLTTTVGGNTTKISQETTARSTADTALGNRITATDAIAKNAQSRVGTAETAISNATSAIATLRTDLTASYSVADTRSTNQTPAWYQTNHPRQVVREFKTASAVGVSGAGYAYLETTVKYGDASGGNVTQEATNNDGTVYIRKGSGTTWQAWVQQEDVTGSAAKVEAARKVLDGKINTTDARVTAEKKVAADATSAVAKTVGTLTTTVNGHTSTINETKTSLNGIAAKWAMETNVNGKVSGIYQHSTGKKSGLDIITDKFTLSNGTTAGTAPFRQEGSTTYLNMAVIKSASIETAKIANLAVKSAQIDDLAVSSAKIANLAVTTGKIANLSVDTLQIKDFAVTVPRTLYNGSIRVRDGKVIGQGYFEIHSGTAGGSGSSVKVEIGIDRYNDTDPNTSFVDNFRLMRDGVELKKWNVYPTGSNSNGKSLTKMYFIYAQYLDKPTKPVTYSLQFKSVYAQLDGVSLSLTEVKK